MEQKTGAVALEFAGFWRRLGAFLLDVIIVSIVTSIIFPFRWFPVWGLPQSLFHVRELFDSSLSLLIFGAYNVAFWAWRGQTPGMMLLSVRVMHTDATGLTLGYALLRYLGYFISGAVLGLGFLWIAVDARRQGWHDKIADTYVVKVPPPTLAHPVMTSPRPSVG